MLNKLPDQGQTLLIKGQIIEKSFYSPPKLVKIDLTATQASAAFTDDGGTQVS